MKGSDGVLVPAVMKAANANETLAGWSEAFSSRGYFHLALMFSPDWETSGNLWAA